MDKKTCMILLLGLIFVVLLTNTGNYLEGLETSDESTMQDSIKIIKPVLDDRETLLDSNPGISSNAVVIDNYMVTGTKINGLQSQYSDLNKTDTTQPGINSNSRIMYRKTSELASQYNTLNNEIENIDTSLEKMNDSKVTYTEYQYQSLIWGILSVGLGVACITTIM